MPARTRAGAAQNGRRNEALRLLWDASRAKDLKGLRSVLRDRREDLRGALDTQDPTSERNNTALTYCCSGFAAGVDLLVAEGAGVDASIHRGFTPLLEASTLSYIKIVI